MSMRKAKPEAVTPETTYMVENMPGSEISIYATNPDGALAALSKAKREQLSLACRNILDAMIAENPENKGASDIFGIKAGTKVRVFFSHCDMQLRPKIGSADGELVEVQRAVFIGQIAGQSVSLESLSRPLVAQIQDAIMAKRMWEYKPDPVTGEQPAMPVGLEITYMGEGKTKKGLRTPIYDVRVLSL